jgi:hypothetical protein
VIGHGFRGMLSGFGSIVAPSVTTTGRITGSGFTALTGGDNTTPMLNVTGATNYGVALVSNVLRSVIAGNNPFTVSSANATTDTAITLQVGGKIQTYSTQSFDVTAQLDNHDGGNYFLYFANPTAARSITGWNSSPATGDVKFIFNVAAGGSGFNLTFEHEHGSSTDINRFLGLADADVVVPPGGAAIIAYKPTTNRWRVAKLF